MSHPHPRDRPTILDFRRAAPRARRGAAFAMVARMRDSNRNGTNGALAARLGAALCVAMVAMFACVAGCGSSSGGLASSSDDGGAGEGGTPAGVSFPPTGNQYVDARRCPACHQGTDPRSTGFMSGAVDPIPGDFGPGVSLYGPNLTPDMTTGIGAWTDDEVSTAILSGIDNMGERLCPQMQHFPDMQMPELTSILGYLHSLQPVSHQAPASHCPPLKP